MVFSSSQVATHFRVHFQPMSICSILLFSSTTFSCLPKNTSTKILLTVSGEKKILDIVCKQNCTHHCIRVIHFLKQLSFLLSLVAMDSARSWFTKLQTREKSIGKKKELPPNGKEGTDEAPSSATKQRVAAAKQYIEKHYKEQMKNLQDRKERYGGSAAFSSFLFLSVKIMFQAFDLIVVLHFCFTQPQDCL